MSFIEKLKELGLHGKTNLLLLDGHYSHVFNIDFIELMDANQIKVLCLPPHTTQLLQPLDVSVFSPFKAYWNKFLRRSLRETAGMKLSKSQLWKPLSEALTRCLTIKNITAGFRGTGLYPVNRGKITDEMLSTNTIDLDLGTDPDPDDSYEESDQSDNDGELCVLRIVLLCFGVNVGVGLHLV
jgi:hypothetical protein